MAGEVVSFCDLAFKLWECTASCRSRVQDLEENLETLSTKMADLGRSRQEVDRRVDRAKAQQLEPFKIVTDWLAEVDAARTEIDDIVEKGRQAIQRKCLWGMCPVNCRSRYKLGKRIEKTMKTLERISANGSFDEVAERPLDPVVVERPQTQPVGVESMFDDIWRYVIDDTTRLVGIYGMGGVGKTTLLKKIHNKFVSITHNYDLVIWIVASKDANLDSIQRVIWDKLKLPESEWNNSSNKDDRAAKILPILMKKRSLLFLDDVWSFINLLDLGIPVCDPNHQNGSKIIFTTRFQEVCSSMRSKSFKVVCLPPEKALELFKEHVGEETWDAHHEIPRLAKTIVEECKGLPLALIVVGRAMAGKMSPEEWMHDIDVLKKSPSKFADLKDEVFVPLEFSYNHLSETAKKCFRYCSVFPEDHQIERLHLIELWMGEGFLDEYGDSVYKARYYGESIISSLIRACLLEPEGHDDNNNNLSVKMHDVVRDMAIWISSGYDLKNDDVVVIRKQRLSFEAEDVKKWEAAKVATLWYVFISSEEYWPRDLTCTNLSTLLFRDNSVRKLPTGMFSSMPSLIILDLSRCVSLEALPDDIGRLINLQYLNVERTRVTELPMEMKNLTKLIFLFLDHTCRIRSDNNVLLHLPSVRLFRWIYYDSEYMVELEEDELNLMEALQGMKKISEISLALASASGFQKLLSSTRLWSCIRELSLEGSLRHVPPMPLRAAQHLVCFDIFNCQWEEIDIDEDDIIGRRLGSSSNPKSFATHDYFPRLRDITLSFCKSLLHATQLILGAPSLEVLHIHDCLSMKEVIKNTNNADGIIIEANQVTKRRIFTRLRTMKLKSLSNLEGIFGSDYDTNALILPSLELLEIDECPRLKRLPLEPAMTSAVNFRAKILVRQQWWEDLHWDDPETSKELLSSKVEFITDTKSWWDKLMEFGSDDNDDSNSMS